MRKIYLFFLVIVIASCSTEKEEAYAGLKIGVPIEQFNSQIDSLVRINKLMWQEEEDSKIAYGIQYFKEKPVYVYVIPNGSPARIENLSVDIEYGKTLSKSLISNNVKGVQLHTDQYRFNGELPYSELEVYILNQLTDKYGKDYQSDSKIINNGLFEEQQIISLETKTWLTKSYKIELKHYSKDSSHKIRVVYSPVVENTNQF